MKRNYLKYPFIVFLSSLLFLQSVFAGIPPDLVGESAILMDRKTGSILYEKNGSIEMYPASTTKILSSILFIENMDLPASMRKTNKCIQNVPSDSSHIGLRVGDAFSVLDGIYAVMLGSDNYIAYELGVLLDGTIENFARRMNQKARQIGADHSHFVNPHGYHDPDHYTTAYDLALIADYAFRNDTFRHIAKQPIHTLQRQNDPSSPITFSHTVKLLQTDSPYYSPDVIGGKTGFNTPAGRCLVAVSDQDGMELVGVVLKSTSPEFFEDMNALFNYGFENFSLKTKDHVAYIENHSFSPWAKDIVSFSLDHQLIHDTTRNYQISLSKGDFIDLLIRTAYVAQYGNLEGFSNELATRYTLDWGLVQSTSKLTGFNDPLNRETAARLTTQILSSLGYQPTIIYPLHLYEDYDSIKIENKTSISTLQQSGIMGSYKGGSFFPEESLTLEEGLSIATQFYKLYHHTPSSYINRL